VPEIGRALPVEEFSRGLAAGVVALGFALVLARTGRLGASGRAPVTGVLMGAAALWAIGRTRALTPGVFLGLVGVSGVAAASGLRAWRHPAVTAPLAAAPFAWLLALAPAVPSTGWVRALVAGTAAVGSVAASRTDAEWGITGLTPVLYAITAFGVFAAVPDTEEAAALLGASLPAALAGWPLGRARLGRGGAGTATALVVWVAAVGGRGRPPSIVGAVACLGLLVTLPAGRWLARRIGCPGGVPRFGHGAVPVLVAHTAVVALASRVAGISGDLGVAVPVAAAAVMAALAASTWLFRR
jgi:hypothetical protein